MKKLKKKKVEFSKIITAFLIAILAGYGLWSGIEYYRLAKLAIETNSIMPDATLAVTCVTTLLGALLSYCFYQWGLKNSRNKYGIDADGQPFKMMNSVRDDDAYQERDTVEDSDAENIPNE